ncbi:MAG: DUF4296 domain-containing protein [Bacteroidales bacterium]
MIRNEIKTFFILLLGIIVISSCKGDKEVLSKGKMENILYDLYLSDAYINQFERGSNKETKELYLESVLSRHKVTQAQYDSSLVYYGKHIDMYKEIYVSLIKRMDRDNKQLEKEMFIEMEIEKSPKGDSVNLIKDNIYFAFSSLYSANSLITLQADDNYNKGERFIIDCDLLAVSDSITELTPHLGVLVTYSDYSTSTHLNDSVRVSPRIEFITDPEKEIKSIELYASDGGVYQKSNIPLFARITSIIRIHLTAEQIEEAKEKGVKSEKMDSLNPMDQKIKRAQKIEKQSLERAVIR